MDESRPALVTVDNREAPETGPETRRPAAPARPPRGVAGRKPAATPSSEAAPVGSRLFAIRDHVDAFARPGSVAHRELIARFGGANGTGLAVIVVLTALVAPGSIGSHAVWFVLGTIAAVSGVVLWNRPRAMPLWVQDLMLVGATSATCVAAIHYETVRTALPFVILPLTMMVHGLRPLGVTLLHACVVAIGYAAVLTLGPEQPAPAARWFALMAAFVATGAFIRWMVLNIRRIVIAENQARIEAEAVGVELATVSEAKSAFLARMSHELRTPLNAVVGFADVLREGFAGPLDDRQRGYVQDIADAGNHLLSLVDDVLDLSKVEAGDLQLDTATFDLRDVAEDAVRMVRERAARNRIQLRLETAVASAPVTGDERKIRQVVVNLLANALRFTDAGGRVTVLLDGNAGWAWVSVRDTGIGIPDVDLDRIFLEYEQLGTRSGGTGLGLPLARRYAEAHGGRLEVASRAGVGSAFTMSIPRRPLDTEEVPAEEVAPGVDDEFDAFTVPGSPANRVLLGWVIASWCKGVVIGGSILALLLPGAVLPRLLWAGVCLSTSALVVVQPRIGLRFGPGVFDVVLVAGIAAISVQASLPSPLQDLVPVMYGWIVVVTFAVWSSRRGVAQLVVIAAVYGVIQLARWSDDPMAGVQWVAVVGNLVLLAGVIHWLATLLRQSMHTERETRIQTEAVGARLIVANRHKSEFLASMSHELRSPLNAIIGFADVLIEHDRDALTPQQREYASEIGDAGRHLLGMINDILDLAKLNAGQLVVEPEPVSVAGVLARVASGRAAVDVIVPEPLPDVHADPERLTQVIDDLVSCSAEIAAPGSRVVIESGLHSELLRFEVRTRASAETRPTADRVVDALHGSFDASLSGDGFGLGLALARGLTELHGGWIEANVDDEHHVVLRVSLPAATAPVAA